jgi:hypothetical protein
VPQQNGHIFQHGDSLPHMWQKIDAH